MQDDIETLRAALAGLNDALKAVASHGIKAEIDTIDTTSIRDSAPCPIITVQLTKTRTEIDVRM